MKPTFRVKILRSLVAGIIPLYLLLSFSTQWCSFHHTEDQSSELAQEASGHSKDGPSADFNDNFCKHSHDISPAIYPETPSVSLSLKPLEQVFLFSSQIIQIENKDINPLRGPPSTI